MPVIEKIRELVDEGPRELQEAIGVLCEQLEAEREALERDASIGRSALDASGLGVVLVGPDGLTTYINPKALRMLEPRVDPLGKVPIEAVPLAELQEVVTAAIGGRDAGSLDARTGLRDLEVSANPLPDGGALATLRDVTRDREAQRARTDFVANVSHELRTPVTAIMGYAETMLHDADRIPEDLQPMLEKIDRNARRLRDLFEDLLQLHRVEIRRRELPLDLQPLRPILEEAVIGAADNALQQDKGFALNCAASLQACCNAEALRTMVSNLTSNAVNYTPAGGSIAVSATRIHDEVVVTVSDDGIGIDPMHHQRIFERFYRVDDARSRRLGGTGLGLALVKHLALASRSRISVESHEGKGSRFRIHLADDK